MKSRARGTETAWPMARSSKSTRCRARKNPSALSLRELCSPATPCVMSWSSASSWAKGTPNTAAYRSEQCSSSAHTLSRRAKASRLKPVIEEKTKKQGGPGGPGGGGGAASRHWLGPRPPQLGQGPPFLTMRPGMPTPKGARVLYHPGTRRPLPPPLQPRHPRHHVPPLTSQPHGRGGGGGLVVMYGPIGGGAGKATGEANEGPSRSSPPSTPGQEAAPMSEPDLSRRCTP